MKDLEAHLLERPQLEDLEKLRAALAEAEKARASLERQLVQLEEKNTALEGTGTKRSNQEAEALKPHWVNGTAVMGKEAQGRGCTTELWSG